MRWKALSSGIHGCVQPSLTMMSGINRIWYNMCFSPSVSFGAGAVLSVIGIAAASSARTTPQRVLAAVPLLFALQQFTEGIVWMSLLYPAWEYWRMAATYAFLIFAQIIWPVFIPYCALLFEDNNTRRKVIVITLFAGIALAAYTGISLCLHTPVAVAEAHHIRYVLEFPLARKWYYGLIYFIPTILSLLLSSKRSLHWLGYLLLGSYLFSRLLFHWYVISVWCFFGAVISMVILGMILEMNRKSKVA
ncbi:MAG TPA: DUF6629 family protein [Chitinophaga sp.]|uniref:DUF6629 family protein n=1 Tax=Chitinophaga sp. TaxID=1869181 RepID=UPI002C23C553|nr:DUF6629 family protein [Chitinophaga sp.]HVI46071.1 DUF6629 family protein [Chitinophaga sp.]